MYPRITTDNENVTKDTHCETESLHLFQHYQFVYDTTAGNPKPGIRFCL